jgi:hypothetical protein
LTGPVGIPCGVTVGVPVDVLVYVNVHVVVITTAVVPVAVVGDDGAHGHARAKSHQRVRIGVIGGRRVINRGGIVGRHIDGGGTGRLDLDDSVGHDDNLLLDRFLDDHVGNRHDLLR